MASCHLSTAPAEGSAGSVSGLEPRVASKQRRPRDLKQRKKQKTCRPASPPPADPGMSRLSYVVELRSDTIFGYLGPVDVAHLLQVCPAGFSQEFIHAWVLQAINQFAVDNETHLGWGCSCDWMRSLDFSKSSSKCPTDQPFGVKKSLSVLQRSDAARNFLHALVFAQEHLKPLCSYDPQFVPLVCPLVTTGTNVHLSSKAAVTRAMNSLHPGAGSRFFYKFQNKKTSGRLTWEHWESIDSSTCGYCEGTEKHAVASATCQRFYQPMKAAMEKELQYVRFVPKPRSQRKIRDQFDELVAGVSRGGVLCGLYIVLPWILTRSQLRDIGWIGCTNPPRWYA